MVGKREEKFTLGTRDPSEAKALFAIAAAEVESRWKNLRRGLISLSERQAAAIAGEIYREIVDGEKDYPSDNREHRIDALMHDRLGEDPKTVSVAIFGDQNTGQRFLAVMQQRRVEEPITKYLNRHGLRIDPQSRKLLETQVGRAIYEARQYLQRLTTGDWREDPNGDRFPVLEKAETSPPEKIGKRTVLDAFEGYLKERKPSAATEKRWRPIITAVSDEVGDISDLTDDWCIAWKNRLLDQGLENGTVQNAYLGSLRTVCEYAVDQKWIRENPVAKISVRVQKKRRTRAQKGFTHDEARTILKATLQSTTERMTPEGAAARRWVPWLCAYTGARVGEIAQLRKEDVRQSDGVWVFHITPEAGTTKNAAARDVPLHSHLIEQGFLSFVAQSRSGPLFYDPRMGRGGTVANPTYKKIGERIGKWVRSLGINDPELQPNHGWRHRFTSVVQDPAVLLKTKQINYIQGHAPSNVGEEYGDCLPAALKRGVDTIPRIIVDGL